MRATLWGRFSAESKVSLSGAIVIAVFLVVVAVPTIVHQMIGVAPLIWAFGALHLLTIAAVAALTAIVVRQALLDRVSPRLRLAVVIAGVPVLAGVWLFDWTLACVWVATVFLLFRGRWGLLALLASLADVFLALFVTHSASPDDLLSVLSLSLFTVFAIFIPIRLVIVSDRLVLAQEEVARLHVDEERTRIERDLHDILGRTLVSVSLRNQTALRMLELGRHDQAREQIEVAHDVITDGQTQLRAITHGPTIVDLSSELSSAEKLCARTSIDWDAEVDDVGSVETQRLVAAVLREAITNMLKYSRPSRCWLRIRREGDMVAISITNDGCPTDMHLNPMGTGLTALQGRCAQSGGTLDARSPQPGLFRVLAHLPVTAPVVG